MSDASRIDDKQVIESVESLLKNEFDSHDEFNTAFNGADPLNIPSLDRDHDGYNFETSELLFFADRDAYYNEYQIWDDGNISEEHKLALSTIDAYDQRSRIKELVEAIVRRRVVPFIGAGMSVACKYPSWDTALKDIKAKVEGVDEALFDKAMSDFDYLAAAQLLWDCDSTQMKSYIYTKFADKRLPDDVLGPILHIPHFCHGCVITTNFDPIVEAAFKKAGKESFDGYMHGVQAPHKFIPKLIKGDRCLLKLHGDAEDDESFVFTRDQYKEAYGDARFSFRKPLPRALRQIFVGHSLLFLGCSLENDKTLELFGKVYNQDFEIPNHFAILPEPDGSGETRAQKENRLLELNIHPIWFPDGEFHHIDSYLRLLIDASTKRIRV